MSNAHTLGGTVLVALLALSGCDDDDGAGDSEGRRCPSGGYTGSTSTSSDGCTFDWSCSDGTFRLECTDANTLGEYSCLCFENDVQTDTFDATAPAGSSAACNIPDIYALEILSLVETGCGWTDI